MYQNGVYYSVSTAVVLRALYLVYNVSLRTIQLKKSESFGSNSDSLSFMRTSVERRFSRVPAVHVIVSQKLAQSLARGAGRNLIISSAA